MQERLPAPEFDSPTGSVFPPPAGRRVYCNRNLRLDQVKAVGFDMDYTLAIYRQAEMDRLCIDRYGNMANNVARADGSVENVKLMDLWRQPWHRNWVRPSTVKGFDR